MEETLDERIKQLLRDLGNAINESISASTDVNEQIQRIRDEGYNLYVVLDATIGVGRTDEDEETSNSQVALTASDIQFRINVNDLSFLRSVGIDPTRKVRTPRRLDAKSRTGNSE